MAHKEDNSEDWETGTPQLPLLTSPLIRTSHDGPTPVSSFPPGPDLTEFGYRDGPPQTETPEFQRHDDATAIEVFYDLFFAANLTVFSEVVDVTNAEKLATFVVYFSLLWFNWALLGLYDVRFITDSIFERCARAVHIGVMVSFSVIAPNFSLSSQQSATFQTMSIVLMTSRLAMALQYGTILWYCWPYRRGTRVPLALMIGLNFIAGIIYLGLGFAFNGSNRSLYSVWFIITAVEVLVSVGLSLKWDVLSFQGTHLTQRVFLLTFILLGEALCLVGLAVVRIVQNANSWTSPTIGNVTAGVANVYVLFMIYFDWRHSLRLGRYKQLIWTFLHFPFHLVLRIFLEGSTQFVTWWKVFETMNTVSNQFAAAMDSLGNSEQVGTKALIRQITNVINDVFNVYVPMYTTTTTDIERYIEQINGTIPESWWATEVEGPIENDPTFKALEGIVSNIGLALENSLLAGFKIDGFAAFRNTTVSEEQLDNIELQISQINQDKFDLVFKYAFIAAGITLILMNILFIITSTRKWSLWNYINKAVNFLIGIGLCLMALITLDVAKYGAFTATPWPLPTILLAFFAVLSIHHLPRPPPMFFGRKMKAGRKPNTEGWEAVSAIGFRDKVVDDTSFDRGSGQSPETPGPQVVDTSYHGGGGRP